MGVETKIQWCDHTFNPWIGCAKVSPGCEHCYAEAEQDHRYHRAKWGVHGTRHVTSDENWKKPLRWDREAAAAGERRRVFCASLADVFEDRPELEAPRIRLFGLIDRTPHLDWLLLTKRPENWRRCWPMVPVPGHVSQDEGDGRDWKRLPNVWLGTSVEDQRRARERIPELLRARAAVRFLSVEPLLGPIDLGLWRVAIPKHRESWPTERVSNFWVIVGGESGPHARPCDLAWIRSIRDQCRAAGVPVFIKQLGARPFVDRDDEVGGGIHRDLPLRLRDPKGGDIGEFPPDLQIRESPR